MISTTAAKYFLENTRHDAWDLMGPSNSGRRQMLMLLIAGEKLPKAKCGVTEIENRLFSAAGVDGSGMCLSERRQILRERLTAIANQ